MEANRRRGTREALRVMADVFSSIDPDEQRGHLSNGERLGLMWEARRLADRVTALAGILTAEAERHDSAQRVTGTPLTSLISLEEHQDPKTVAGSLAQGRQLVRYKETARAALEGRLSPAHARGIARTMAQLPRTVSSEQARQVEARLVERASIATPSELAGKAEEVLAEIAPDLVPSAADEAQRLKQQRARALRTRFASWGDAGDGSTWLKAQLPNLEAQRLINTLEASVAAAKRTARHTRGPEVTRPQRMADALASLAGGPPARTGTQAAQRAAGWATSTVVVVIKEADLYARAAATGLLPSGAKLSAGELRRLCCQADLLPLVLGTDSEILDVGLIHRLVTPSIRRALGIRDGGCIFPHCDAPDAECEAHHVIGWQHGGPTSLENLVLLCAHHHALVEPRAGDEPAAKWRVQFDPDTRQPRLLRPAPRAGFSGAVTRAGPATHYSP